MLTWTRITYNFHVCLLLAEATDCTDYFLNYCHVVTLHPVYSLYTVEPLYNEHLGTSHFWVIFALYRDFPLSEVKMY